MIPVASSLLRRGHTVYIGSGEEIANFFRSEIDGLKYIHFPGFTIRYSSWLPQYIKIALSIPSFLYRTRKEHIGLQKLIRQYSIDIVISDSRLGLWNRDVRTAFVTHMMRVPFPRYLRFLENSGKPFLKKLFSRFDYCFIPDLPDEPNLAGKLSHVNETPHNVRYIGILSRFSNDESDASGSQYRYFCTVILSGPEPQRSILKRKLALVLKRYDGRCLFLEGKPGSTREIINEDNLEFVSHLPAAEMKKTLQESRYIVSRSGYTTIMELVSIRKSALLIATPGQSEQEYLALLMSERGWFGSVAQSEIDNWSGLTPVEPLWPASINRESSRLLENALDELLEQEHESGRNEKSG